INESWYLVDLPGYGYASLSKSAKAALSEMIESYFTRRQNLMNVYLLVDCRHAPQPIDLEFMAWLAGNGLPFTIVFTKSDKLTRQQLSVHTEQYKRALSEEWEELPPMMITSSETGLGREGLLSEIKSLCTQFGGE
ncbi:MAG: GTP-binding protein, partial [Bacteroidota bacterium]